MKNFHLKNSKSLPIFSITIALFFALICTAQAQEVKQTYTEFKGEILDSKTKKALVFADLNVSDTNISTVTNTEGEFALKVPNEFLGKTVTITYLGYIKHEMALADFDKGNTKITLDTYITLLPEVNINAPKDAISLVRATLKQKGVNYFSDQTVMTAFYRETIKKRKSNASLSEAVIEIYKQPIASNKRDILKLIKSRKSTDYSKLDTLAVKLQGGPFSSLYTDVVKYPEYIFNEENLTEYQFTFDNSTQIDGRRVYVVNFKQNQDIKTPLYYGKLFIDSETYALTSAIYNLNVENRELASRLFLRKKPRKVVVYPTQAAYRVDYRSKNGKWYFGYSNIQLTFKVNWKGRLFNSLYTLNSEMAVTNWETNAKTIKQGERLKPSIILSEEASGFSDPEFWGEYNIIEPEKSIESAIKKIKKQLNKAAP